MKNYIIIICLVFYSCTGSECSTSAIEKKLKIYNTLKENGDSLMFELANELYEKCGYSNKNIEFDKALNYYAFSDWYNAIPAFNRAMELGYDKDIILYNRALCYSSIGESERAWKDYQEFTSLNELGDSFREVLEYNIYKNLGKYKEALLVLEDIISNNPNSVNFVFDKGIIQLNLGDTIGFCESIEKAAHLGLEDDMLLNLGDKLAYCNKIK